MAFNTVADPTVTSLIPVHHEQGGLELDIDTGGALNLLGGKILFNGAAITVTGSRTGSASEVDATSALTSLLAQLAAAGIITDNTTAT